MAALVKTDALAHLFEAAATCVQQPLQRRHARNGDVV